MQFEITLTKFGKLIALLFFLLFISSSIKIKEKIIQFYLVNTSLSELKFIFLELASTSLGSIFPFAVEEALDESFSFNLSSN
jgi:hypothetical protein